MDVLTHFFIPYIAALFALGLHRLPRDGVQDVARRETLVAHAVVFGLAGFAPDLDSLFSWARHMGGLYWLQHRGVSHTLLFAPFFALLGTFALHGLALWRPGRFGRFRFRPTFVPMAVLGAWTHLALDAVTYAGVPLWWPFSFERVGRPFFHWIVVWMFPLLAGILGFHLWGKLRTHHVAWLGVVALVVLVVLAGVREHYRPDLVGAETFPRSNLGEWLVVYHRPYGYEAVTYRWGVPVDGSAQGYLDEVANGTEWAVAAAQDTATYQGFLMGQVGPVATTAYPDEAGGARVVFTDVAARYEAQHDPHWTPTDPFEDWGYVVFRVTPEGDVVSEHRGW